MRPAGGHLHRALPTGIFPSLGAPSVWSKSHASCTARDDLPHAHQEGGMRVTKLAADGVGGGAASIPKARVQQTVADIHSAAAATVASHNRNQPVCKKCIHGQHHS